MIYNSLQELLDELMAHPDQLYINSGGGSACIYSTLHGAFLFLDGDFTGTEEQQDAEIARIMKDVEEGRVG